MSRHHNRAILAAITEQGLDPNGEYVKGKNGLIPKKNRTEVSKEDKKEEKPLKVESTPLVEEVLDEVVEVSDLIEAAESTKELPILPELEEPQVQEKISTKLEKETKFKKKQKSKLDQS